MNKTKHCINAYKECFKSILHARHPCPVSINPFTDKIPNTCHSKYYKDEYVVVLLDTAAEGAGS
jgi:hypothetical protein